MRNFVMEISHFESTNFISFMDIFFVNVLPLLKYCIFCFQIIKVRDERCMLYYIHEKLQLNNSRVKVTLITTFYIVLQNA